MREKKVVEISRFDNFQQKSSDVVAKSFYNYSPNKFLENSKGVTIAKFQKNPTSKIEKELKILDTNITSIEGLSYFKQYYSNGQFTTYRLLIYGNDKRVYINQMLDDSFDMFWLYSLEFNSPPIVLTYKKNDADAVIIASEDQMKIWRTGYSPQTIEDVPIITSMCMNEGVLFCTIKEPAFKVWYALDLNAEKIGEIGTSSGFVSLDDELGDARKILTFNEDVYVFRDYGISKINCVKNEITVSQIYLSNTKVYANTVSLCGNCILFMTKDGLYSFNGVKVKKVDIDLSEMTINNDAAVASSLGEKYYVALNIDFGDDKQVLCEQSDYVNNAIIEVDTEDYSYEIIRGVDVKFMLPVKTETFEKMLVIFNSGPIDKIGEIKKTSKYIDENLPKFWASDRLVKNSNTKLFTKLSVNADEGVKFTIKYDNKEINFTTYTSGINEFMFKICCKDIALEISSQELSAVVKKVSLDYYEY